VPVAAFSAASFRASIRETAFSSSPTFSREALCIKYDVDDHYRPMGSQRGWLGKCSVIAETSSVPPFENTDQKENRSCYLQLRLYCVSCGPSAS